MRRLALAMVGLLAIWSSACSDTGWEKPMQIVNRTAAHVEVEYHVALSTGADSVFTTLEVMPNAMAEFGVPSYDGSGCGNGTLIARSNGIEVAHLDRPCSGWVWEITTPPPS